MKAYNYLLIAILCGTAAADAFSAEKPNIVIIYADDMGFGDCTVNNPESKIHTPNIDRLAKEGLRFTDAQTRQLTSTNPLTQFVLRRVAPIVMRSPAWQRFVFRRISGAATPRPPWL